MKGWSHDEYVSPIKQINRSQSQLNLSSYRFLAEWKLWGNTEPELTGWNHGKYDCLFDEIQLAYLHPFYSTGRSFSILRPCASSILFSQKALQSLAELVMTGWGHGEYVSPMKQLYITQSTCRLDNTNAKTLLCYIYRHFAWSIKLGIVMLWGEKCQLTAMVTTDAEIYKGRAFLWLAIPSQRREMASCSIRLRSRQGYIFALLSFVMRLWISEETCAPQILCIILMSFKCGLQKNQYFFLLNF